MSMEFIFKTLDKINMAFNPYTFEDYEGAALESLAHSLNLAKISKQKSFHVAYEEFITQTLVFLSQRRLLFSSAHENLTLNSYEMLNLKGAIILACWEMTTQNHPYVFTPYTADNETKTIEIYENR